MAKKLPLKSFRLKNFKAIRDSGVVKFTPLTVLIGDNGSGKSSLIEGLRTYQRIVTDGLDAAMNEWRGFEFIRYGDASQGTVDSTAPRPRQSGTISMALTTSVPDGRGGSTRSHSHRLVIACSPLGDTIFIMDESWNISGRKYLTRDADGFLYYSDGKRLEGGMSFPISFPMAFESEALPSGKSLLSSSRADLSSLHSSAGWQFLSIDGWNAGAPRPVQRTGGGIRLRRDGSNIAEYMSALYESDPSAFEGIIETMQFVMPYMCDLEPVLTDVLGHQMHLEMREKGVRVPGWLLSTGTLRILALLALFRHPEPPPLIIIEELENGLDPRVIHLIVEEIRNVVEDGRSQIIVTTHSPYLLNLLPLWSIVLVERTAGEPAFCRPADREDLDSWSRRFAPGDLYTMGALSSENGA